MRLAGTKTFGAALPIMIMTAALSSHANAQTKAGTTMGQFLLIEPSARVSAMGNAGVALSDGIQAIYFNPAAAARVESRALQFTHTPWLADITHDYAALLVPVKGVGSFFATLTSLGSGEIDVRTVEAPLGTGERYTVSNLAIGVGYARWITPRFSAGLQATYIEETIWHTSVRTVTFNVGTVYRLTESGLQFGSSLSHLGTHARFKGRDLRVQFDDEPDRFGDNSALPAEQFTEEFPVPILLRIGLSHPWQFGEESRLLAVLDAVHPRDNSESLAAGAEWLWRNTLALRGGYQDMGQDDSELGFTFGGGVSGDIDAFAFALDYGWADHGRLGATHRVTLAVTF